MICRTCLRRAATTLPLRTVAPIPLARPFSISASTRSSPAGSLGTSEASPASSTAEPTATPTLSTPIDLPSAAAAKPVREPSSCKAGTVLNGLNYFKGKTDPVALADEEYPDWLWDCLVFKAKEDADADAGAADEFSKSAKLRRKAAKRKAKLLAEGGIDALAPKVPLFQQSINLPGEEGGSVEDNLMAAGKREELRQAMRSERKRKIKESNYLKSM
ncbi:54S ribosomal protein L37 like [Verticillium longisporum]|uniref:Large ribosomal subunit protein mL54 n=6 Tax=Verticillium TaxID=1036719 RepID=G2X260_VERDV|nr:uncharacterized protein VDAG_04384 [Verticillium dahliae VdLs.17]KAF3346235.1 Calcium-independent phospholipase A2-gamma [Verticillium dahliae VDG2]KAF3360376.1 Coatomer subunit beta [Verticillium dahliae VDG1]KAG7102118.1 54S ribosomal protein L37 like [Verticillium longisporum]KAH6700268.1 mitochondrial ribosomal protein L37-domain-containing protein [Verticillium dahliae]EGY22946.1 hypothetical protein VDAG_04384 [Verticillium dahliae VdLs.17]